MGSGGADEESAALLAVGGLVRRQLLDAIDLDRTRAERDGLVGGIDADLLGEYDELRKRSGGIAIARLVSGHCGGCHLSLSAVEIDRIKKLPPEAPAHCEECGRLLAR